MRIQKKQNKRFAFMLALILIIMSSLPLTQATAGTVPGVTIETSGIATSSNKLVHLLIKANNFDKLSGLQFHVAYDHNLVNIVSVQSSSSLYNLVKDEQPGNAAYGLLYNATPIQTINPSLNLVDLTLEFIQISPGNHSTTVSFSGWKAKDEHNFNIEANFAASVVLDAVGSVSSPGPSPSQPPITGNPAPIPDSSTSPSPEPTDVPTVKPTASPMPAAEPSSKPDEKIKLQKEHLEVKLAGDAIQTTKGKDSEGREFIRATLDAAKLNDTLQAMANPGKSQGKGIKSKLVINIKGGDTPLQLELPSSVLINVAKSSPDVVLTLKTDHASYDLPVTDLNFAAIAQSLGFSEADVQITVQISPALSSLTAQMQEKAEAAGAKLITQLVDFKVLASANGKQIELKNLGQSYIERSLDVPANINADHSTGLRFDPNTGEFFFVPTVFELTSDGRTVATLKRKGNSIYTVMESSKSFEDLNGHWAKDEIELLASKQVIAGRTIQRFAPNETITRAEFASLLVRALGLSDLAVKNPFKDIGPKDWYSSAIAIAASEGLVSGEGDGKFHPNGEITREQMATMIVHALKIAGKSTIDVKNGEQALNAFTADKSQISSWAKDSVGTAVAAGLLQGADKQHFRPAGKATRAEAAVVLKRFLQYVEFIN